MNKPCQHFEQMQQYLEDCAVNEKPWELWELREVEQLVTNRVEAYVPLGTHPAWRPETSYRRKPPAQKYILIGDVEVPEPLRVAPETGCGYYTIWAFGMVKVQWNNHRTDLKALDCGIAHLSKEAADIHFEALCKLHNQPGHPKP